MSEVAGVGHDIRLHRGKLLTGCGGEGRTGTGQRDVVASTGEHGTMNVTELRG